MIDPTSSHLPAAAPSSASLVLKKPVNGPIPNIISSAEFFQPEISDVEVLVNCTNDLLWSVSSDLKLITANRSFIQSIILSTGNTIQAGDDILNRDALPGDLVVFWEGCYHRALAGESFKKEIATPAINKLPASWAEISFNPIYKNDCVTGVACFSRDITENKRSEEAMKKAFEEKNTVLERIDDGFFAVNEQSIVTYWNKRAEILLNVKKADIIGKNLHEVFASPGTPNAFYNNYHRAITENITVHFEEFSMRTNKWFSVSSFASGNGLSVYFKDITDQKNADQKLKESEQRYRSLIEQATDAICIADSSLRFVDMNASGCRMFGYSREEILQLTIPEVLFEDDMRANPIKIDGLKAGETIHNERRIKKKDGTALDVELNGRMLEDGRLIIFGRDISERKEWERSIKVSEAKYRSFFESSMDGILLTVTDGEILAANPAACEIFQMTEEEICAAGRLGLADKNDARLYTLLEERRLTGKVKGELTLVRKDGSKFLAELTSAVFTDAYGQKRTSMIVRDITERKRAENDLKKSNERFNLVISATNDMVWDWNLVTGDVYRNPEGWRKIFRGCAKELSIGSTEEWDLRVHPDDREKVRRVSAEVLRSEKDFYEVECRMLRYDGTYAHIHDRGNIVRDESGKAIRLIGATQDITGRKEAEEILKASENRYRYLFNNNPASIFLWDISNFKLLEVNDTAVKQYGYSRTEFLSKTLFDLCIPEYHEQLRKVASIARRTPDFTSELRSQHTTSTGEEIQLQISAHRIQFKGRPVMLALSSNITDKLKLEADLEKERGLKQQEITEAVILAQERERQALGAELHDNINQVLAGSRLYLGLAKKELKSDHPYLKETDDLLSSAIDEIRNLSHLLVTPSLKKTEFLESLQNIISVTQKTSGINISVDASGFDENAIADKLKLNIYRIVQEQFNNILKHAAAKNIKVLLVQANEKTLLSIKDDGVGFDTGKKVGGVGLMNIKTRASLFNGDVSIYSAPGIGCELRVLFN